MAHAHLARGLEETLGENLVQLRVPRPQAFAFLEFGFAVGRRIKDPAVASDAVQVDVEITLHGLDHGVSPLCLGIAPVQSRPHGEAEILIDELFDVSLAGIVDSFLLALLGGRDVAVFLRGVGVLWAARAGRARGRGRCVGASSERVGQGTHKIFHIVLAYACLSARGRCLF